MMNESDRSLRLCEILEEEYAHLHPDAVNADQQKPVSISTVDLLNETKLLAGLERWLRPESGEKTKDPSPTELRYKKLADWIQNSVETHSTEGEDLLPTVKAIFERKLGADSDLATEELWMQDTSLRPYTRGLLQSYVEQRSLSSRAGSSGAGKMLRRLFGQEPVEQVVDKDLLNRLLLEDAFAGHIDRVDDRRLTAVFGKMRNSGQSAICLSGGGIRSATFALGILQGLVKHKALSKFTYLSTVSGGGYLGGWLSAWIHHEGFEAVDKKLAGQYTTPLQPEAVPVRHLRQYSNYLSPVLGLFSADTWTLFAIYLRNLLLLWLVIIPLLAAATAVPWVIVTVAELDWKASATGVYGAVGLAVLLTIVGISFVHAYQPRPKATSGKKKARLVSRNQTAFLQKCLLPLSAAVVLWMLGWRWFETISPEAPAYLIRLRTSLGLDQNTGLTIFSYGGLAIMLGSACVHLAGWLVSFFSRSLPQRTDRWLEPLVVIVTGGLGGFLLLLTAKLLRMSGTDSNIIAYTCIGVPGFLLAVILAGYAFEGIMSLRISDAQREWSARYSAWLLIVAVGWFGITGLVLWVPALIGDTKSTIILPTLTGAGIVSSLLTALLGKSSKTAGEGEGAGSRRNADSKLSLSSLLANLTLPVAAVITLIALLIVLSLFDLVLMRWLHSLFSADFSKTSIVDVSAFVGGGPAAPFIVMSGLLVIGLVIGLLVDTNKFSLHALYRARLIRAYLGASRPSGERRPDPFTGFDEADNIFMGCMRPPNPPNQVLPGNVGQKTPFHIINIALNLVGGRNLAWQERMAESFTVSALHAGAMYLGYRRTYLADNTGCPDPHKNPRYYGGKQGISLGTAMTISGAAASPSHGYHSSPVVAFLMTLFNVRLGWWLGNPGPAGDTTFHQASPTLAIRPILDEMTGNTDDVNPYVYLSDGGHFENLGLYEMVLRRNRFILISDASCDESCSLEDLGNAIRKIRVDMGIPIDFPQGFNIRSRTDTSTGKGKYWAIGRIGYSKVDSAQSGSSKTDNGRFADNDGILLYIKPGIIGDEPRDIFNYASSRKTFPHETTADQFFSESQFESYRALGACILEQIQADLSKEFHISLTDFVDKAGWERCLHALNKPHPARATNGNGSHLGKLNGPLEVYIRP